MRNYWQLLWLLLPLAVLAYSYYLIKKSEMAITFKRANVSLDKGAIKFVIWYRPPAKRADNIKWYINEWLKETERFTAESLVGFINGQQPKHAMTEAEFEKIKG